MRRGKKNNSEDKIKIWETPMKAVFNTKNISMIIILKDKTYIFKVKALICKKIKIIQIKNTLLTEIKGPALTISAAL